MTYFTLSLIWNSILRISSSHELNLNFEMVDSQISNHISCRLPATLNAHTGWCWSVGRGGVKKTTVKPKQGETGGYIVGQKEWGCKQVSISIKSGSHPASSTDCRLWKSVSGLVLLYSWGPKSLIWTFEGQYLVLGLQLELSWIKARNSLMMVKFTWGS